MIALFFSLILMFLAALACVFWVWMIIDSITNKGLGDGEKICWVLAVIFLHFLGALLYFFIGRPRGRAY
jgi:hypothetical protein